MKRHSLITTLATLGRGFYNGYRRFNEYKKATMVKSRRRGGSVFKRKRRRRYGRRGRKAGRTRRLSSKLFRKGITNVEVKYRDNGKSILAEFLTNNPGTAPTNILEGISQGVGVGQFLGGKLFIRHIKFYAMVRAAVVPSEAVPESYVHLLIVRDRQPADGQATPKLKDIFQSYFQDDIDPTTQSQVDWGIMPFKWTNNRLRGRFQWIWHKIVKVNAGENTGGYSKFIKKRIAVMKPWHLQGENFAGSSNRGPGQLYLFVWSNAFPGAGENFPVVNTVWRVSFTDC